MNKNKLRTAADWWQMLEESQVRTLVSKYYSNKAEPELSAQNVLKIYEAENPTPDSKEGLHTQGEWFLSHSPVAISQTSKRPFKSVKDKNSIGGNIVCNAFGNTKEQAQANAELIVKAVNNHQPLIDALGQLLDRLSYHGSIDPVREEGAIEDARNALKSAK